MGRSLSLSRHPCKLKIWILRLAFRVVKVKHGGLSGNTESEILLCLVLTSVSEEIAMSAFETYIRDLQEIRATGAAVKETS